MIFYFIYCAAASLDKSDSLRISGNPAWARGDCGVAALICDATAFA